MGSFRIAHLSDLHVSHVTANLRRLGRMLLPGDTGEGWWDVVTRFATTSWFERQSLFEPLTRYSSLKHPYDPRLLTAVVEHARDQRSDHAIVTGDLSNLGAASELREAMATLRAFGFSGDRLTVLPGNHDRINLRGTSDWEGVVGGAGYPSLQRINDDIFAIAIDSTAHGANLDWRDMIALNSRGYVSSEDVIKADALLASVPREAMKILCVHHHVIDLPHDGYLDEWADKLDPRLAGKAENAEVLLDVAVARGVGLILFGHRHRPTHDHFEIRGIPASCSGAVTQPDTSGMLRYRVFDFDGPRIVKRTWFELDPIAAIDKVSRPVTSPDLGDDEHKVTVSLHPGDLEKKLLELRDKRREAERKVLEKVARRTRR